MSCEKHDLVITQGETFNQIIKWMDSNGNPVNLSTATARLEARAYESSSISLLVMSTSIGNIETDASGNILLVLSDQETSQLSFQYGIYHLNVTLGDVSIRLCEGRIRVIHEFGGSIEPIVIIGMDFSDEDNSQYLPVVF